MRDIELYTLMRANLVEQVPLRWTHGPLGYMIRYQPQQTGRPSEPTVWFAKVGDKRRGQRKSSSKWNGSQMIRTESQAMETVIQVSATRDFQPTDLVTASDCVNILAGVMQSDRWIESLRPERVQVQHVADVRMQRTKNDLGQWEETPLFDITFSHNDIFVDGQPVFSSFTFDIYRI